MSKFSQVWLSCADKKEASKIAQTLLEKKLIACAKQLPVTSDFHWKGSIEHDDEILLVMTTREDLFEQIETEITKLHSYETFDLQAIPITKISKDAAAWLTDSTK